MRAFVAWLLVVVMLTVSCSKAVHVSRTEARSEEYREPGAYRIKLDGWNEYYARRFSVTDSTVVIEELLKTDDRYKRMRHEMPIVIPLAEVESISRMETNWPITVLVVVGGTALVAGFIHWLGNMGPIGR